MSNDPWENRSANMRCETCVWFAIKKPSDENKFHAIGRCRRHAPTIGGFPVVYLSDWCGDHRLDENKIPVPIVVRPSTITDKDKSVWQEPYINPVLHSNVDPSTGFYSNEDLDRFEKEPVEAVLKQPEAQFLDNMINNEE